MKRGCLTWLFRLSLAAAITGLFSPPEVTAVITPINSQAYICASGGMSAPAVEPVAVTPQTSDASILSHDASDVCGNDPVNICDPVGLDAQVNSLANDTTSISIPLYALYSPPPPQIGAWHPQPQLQGEYDILGNYYLRSQSTGKTFGSLYEARRAGSLDAIEAPPEGGTLDDFRHYFARTGQWGKANDLAQTQGGLLLLYALPGEGGLVAKPLERVAIAGLERRLASETVGSMAKEQLEFAFVKEVERQTVAHDFYLAAGWPSERILPHLRGIDFSMPVTIEELPAGKQLIQYRLPEEPLGHYFAEPGTPALGLGIYTSGLETRSVVVRKSTSALRSTASSVEVDWFPELESWNILAPGGGSQYFIPDKSVLLSH